MIRILSEKNEKGTQFESLLKLVLAKQGYGSIESNIHTTGTEIDIEAKDNVSGIKIRLEAKAHNDTIDSPELKKFVLTTINDIKRKIIDYGIFWSLSGINSTARYYFENELVDELKDRISVKGNKEFQQMLIDLNLIGNNGAIDSNISSLTQKNLLNRELIYYQNQWYFIQYCSQTQERTHFFVVSSFGKIVDDIVAKGIRELDDDLKRLNLILMSTKNRVIEFLMYHELVSLNEINEGIKETSVDIQSVIDELLDQQLIRNEQSTETKYTLNKEIDAFLKICKDFLKDKKMTFMKSPYLAKSVNPSLVSYIENRWHLKLSKEYKKMILKMCLISPSAIDYALFSPTTAIQNQLEQFNQKIPLHMMKINQSSFMTQMAVSVLTDIQYNLSLGLQKTRGALVDINLKMATEDELFFKIRAKAPLVTMKIKGTAKVGQGLVAVSPETYLETSHIFYSLGEIKTAIKEIDDALKHFKNEGEWIKAAYINKGMYLTELGKLDEAKEFLVKATQLYPTQKEGWLNLGNLHLQQGKIPDAKICFEKSLNLDNNYAHAKYGLARVAISTNSEDLCFSLLEELFQLEKRFVTRVLLDKEFKELRKTKRYSELLKKLKLPRKI